MWLRCRLDTKLSREQADDTAFTIVYSLIRQPCNRSGANTMVAVPVEAETLMRWRSLKKGRSLTRLMASIKVQDSTFSLASTVQKTEVQTF